MLSQRLVVYMYVLKKRNGSKSNVKKKSHFYVFMKKIKIKNKGIPGK
jgi:hypothetical protein